MVTTLPDILPIFPLSGALLLPGAQLPLNIFEPRYLRMIDDALAGARMIGMVQPRPGQQEKTDVPTVFDVGCAGRITGFQETEDGRYVITLLGKSRFNVIEEKASCLPYRSVMASWNEWEIDRAPDASGETIDREEFLMTVRDYLDTEGLKTDWETAASAPIDALVASLAMGCPFAPNEKQGLLEAMSVAERAEFLIALMQMSGPNEGGADPTLQ